MIEGYNQFLSAFIFSCNKQKELVTIDLIMLLAKSQITVTVRMLFGMFECTNNPINSNEIPYLPITTNVRSNKNFRWTTFFNNIFHNFVNRFIEEIKEIFSQHEFWRYISKLDPKKLPKRLHALENYGQPELEELIAYCGTN